MRDKMIAVLALLGIVTLLGAYLLLFQPEDVIDPVYGLPTGEKVSIFNQFSEAKDAYDQVKDINYEEQKTEYDRLNSQIAFVESTIHALNASLVNIEAELSEEEFKLRQEKTEEINKKAGELRTEVTMLEKQIADKRAEQAPVVTPGNTYLTSTSDVVYSLILAGLKGVTSDIVTFVGVNADQGYYTLKMVGYFDSLAEVLDNLTVNLEDYGVSIGHCSLRQIYSCYQNMRPWDKTSLLSWFEQKYVTGSGQLGEVDGGFIVNGITMNGILGGDTAESLAEAKDKDIKEIRAFYQEKLDKVEAERIDAIIAAYKGTDADKVNALLASLQTHYNTRVAEINAECKSKEDEILKTYNDRLAALDAPPSEEDMNIGNPDLLIYTLDITISVYDN